MMKKNRYYTFKNPICLQGDISKKNYFEGWYYKLVNSDNDYTCAFIPGISTGGSRYKRHAFIQFVDNSGQLPLYKPYAIRSFSYSDKPFSIRIGGCQFSDRGMSINMHHKKDTITGALTFGFFTDIVRTSKMPTIMGYYRYIPFMECFHSIISLHHTLKGYLKVNNRYIDFTGGTGYLEKDFGTSFPNQWVWIHANTYHNQQASLMCSIASIPFLKKTFLGFLCVLYIDNKEYRFTTYLKGKIAKLSCSKNKVFVEIHQDHLILQIRSMCDDGNVLIAPKNGDMNRKIVESMSSKIKVTLIKGGKILYEAISYNGCMEFNT
ncbi:hypothetical protein HZI73_14995 [Vallitalea pronyensis]|uniref:Tocopherol cyclase n=1 Tax=Vallitalea pronyensis TaxID=1348613 RepID=A0A8J8MKP0_9FIRM|nr:tocopherol cyclase family protein [Vallitalea pronyensis]QUI23510.1 hypothetical protein HZI73_14995 [Vallitalea pronyensis]